MVGFLLSLDGLRPYLLCRFFLSLSLYRLKKGLSLGEISMRSESRPLGFAEDCLQLFDVLDSRTELPVPHTGPIMDVNGKNPGR